MRFKTSSRFAAASSSVSSSWSLVVSDMSDPDYKAKLDENHDAFYRDYGKVLAAWSHVEMMMFSLFNRLTGMEEETARAVFYSARSFTGRADMFAAIISTLEVSPAYRECLKKLLKVAREYSSFRNRVVHGEVVGDAIPDSPHFMDVVITQGKEDASTTDRESTINREMLRNAEMNFRRLAGHFLQTADWDQQGDAWPEKCLALILQLPKFAHLPTTSQNYEAH